MESDSMCIKNQLLTERLRPKNLNSIILLDRVRKLLGTNPLSQNLLLHGQHGTGKSSLAFAVSLGIPTLKINASKARGIDVVREQIVPFCSTLSFDQPVDENLKIVFLDEFDNATGDFYDAMRGTIEQYADNIRFIATCNYPNKITPEVRDRFLELNFSPQNKEEENELFEKYKARVNAISTKVGLNWESEEVVDKFIWNMFPSFRKTISSLQSFMESEDEVITLEDVTRATYSFTDLFELVVSKTDPYKIYQFVLSDYQNKIDEVFSSLGQEFPKWLKEKYPKLSHLVGLACICTADWSYKKQFLNDPILALNACIFQLNSYFKG